MCDKVFFSKKLAKKKKNIKPAFDTRGKKRM